MQRLGFLTLYSYLILLLGFSPIVMASEVTPPRLIHVSGQSIVKAAPDKATINISLYQEAQELADAKRNSDKQLKKLKQIAENLKIEEKHIRTVSTSIQPRYHYGDKQRQLIGYAVNHTIELTLMQLDHVGPLMDALVKAGIDRLQHIQYGLKNEEQLKDEALALAVKRAREKATIMAQAAGVQLGAVWHLSANAHGGISSHPPMMRGMAMAAMAEADVATAPPAGEMEIRAQVQAQYQIQ